MFLDKPSQIMALNVCDVVYIHVYIHVSSKCIDTLNLNIYIVGISYINIRVSFLRLDNYYNRYTFTVAYNNNNNYYA